jgi:hypothetical protein
MASWLRVMLQRLQIRGEEQFRWLSSGRLIVEQRGLGSSKVPGCFCLPSTLLNAATINKFFYLYTPRRKKIDGVVVRALPVVARYEIDPCSRLSQDELAPRSNAPPKCSH